MSSKSSGCCKSQAPKNQKAIMVDGQRYTCEKCRKGHRTGTCTHLIDDSGAPSLLQKTNRAGRPNTTSRCRCPSSDRCTCVKTWYLVVRIPKSEIEPGKEGENNCRIVGTVVKPLREVDADKSDGGVLIATSQGSSGHQCSCGDACPCTYCPEHPDNQATYDHNQFLANQNRPTEFALQPVRQLVESSYQGCGGTAEVTYTCSSDSSAAGQQAILSSVPFYDQNYHYQVYSGQYARGGCPSDCRCPGCITWRVSADVKQQLKMNAYPHEDCPARCNCQGCWSHRERGELTDVTILSLEDFFAPNLPPSSTAGHVETYPDLESKPEVPLYPPLDSDIPYVNPDFLFRDQEHHIGELNVSHSKLI
jgi:hypothetical protein